MKTKEKYFYLFPFKFLIVLFLLCLFPFQNCLVDAAQVRLGWVPPSGTDPDLIGYIVYWGDESRRYIERVDVGKRYTYTITELAEDKTYYFALTSYFIDSYVESDFSNEVSINTDTSIQYLFVASGTDQMDTANQPPIADAGADQYEFPGSLVALNGSNSSDPDGDTLSCLWIQVSGPTVKLDDRKACEPTFTLLDKGIEGKKLIFQLTVTDSKGLQSKDSSCVVIQNF